VADLLSAQYKASSLPNLTAAIMQSVHKWREWRIASCQ